MLVPDAAYEAYVESAGVDGMFLLALGGEVVGFCWGVDFTVVSLVSSGHCTGVAIWTLILRWCPQV